MVNQRLLGNFFASWVRYLRRVPNYLSGREPPAAVRIFDRENGSFKIITIRWEAMWWSALIKNLRIMFFSAIRANAVAELRFGTIMDILLHTLPIIGVIPNLLATRSENSRAAAQASARVMRIKYAETISLTAAISFPAGGRACPGRPRRGPAGVPASGLGLISGPGPASPRSAAGKWSQAGPPARLLP